MRLRLPVTILATAALALPASAAATTASDHLTSGQQLVAGLSLTAWPGQGTINKYDHDGLNSGVTWGTAGVAAGWSNDTKCARLVRELFRRAYTWATDPWFTAEFGSIGPDTEEWQAHLATAHHFDVVTDVPTLQGGDIVTLNKTADVDHTAVVQSIAVLANPVSPVAGTVQYAVRVLDSTSKPHGVNISSTNVKYGTHADSRRSESGGVVTEYEGAGYGTIVLYANADGTVYGWRWGVDEGAIWKVSDGHVVMFGRATVEEGPGA